MPLPLPTSLLPRKHVSLNHFQIYRESPDALNNQAGDYEVVQESPRKSLFKDRYFVSGIAKRFEDPSLIILFGFSKVPYHSEENRRMAGCLPKG